MVGLATPLSTLPQFTFSVPSVRERAPRIQHASNFSTQDFALHCEHFLIKQKSASRVQTSEWSQDYILNEPWQSHLRSTFRLLNFSPRS